MRKTMKKVLLVCLALLACVLMFVACDSGDEPQTPNGTTDGNTTEDSTMDGTTDGTTKPETEAHVHSFGEWTTVKEATCTEKGEQERVCACGEKETQSVDMIAHTEVVDVAVAPTCTETGLSEGKHCSVCNTVLVAQETVKANGHSFGKWNTVKEATCTEKGEQECICACGEKETQSIDMLTHTEVIDEAVAPTCTETGLTEGKHCSVCNTVLVAQKTVKANGHSFGEWITEIEPTCTMDGKKQQSCSVCTHKVEDTIPKQHSLYEHKCTLCNYKDEYLAKFDVSQKDDGSVFAYIYPTSVENEYELCFYGVGAIKDYLTGDIGSPPYYSLHDKITQIVIGNGITRIGAFALNFWDGCHLNSIVLPNTLHEIGNSAFCNMEFLNGLNFPASLEVIDEYAFTNANIGSLVIPDSVKIIGYGAFQGAYITDITFGSGLVKLGGNAFSNQLQNTNTIIDNLKKTTYKNGYYVASGDNPYYMFVGPTAQDVTSLEIHPDTAIIYSSACYECLFLKEVVIPDSVKIVGESAFYGCVSLKNVSLGANVICIAGYAFNSSSNLETVKIENNVSYIGNYNFAHCNNLKTIYFNGSVAEWTAIEFDEHWDYVQSTITIICNDGSISVEKTPEPEYDKK